MVGIEGFLLDEDGNQEENTHDIDVKQIVEATSINKSTVSMGVDTLIEKFNKFDFVLPKYQRKFVWEPEQISKLALSVLKNIPIPPIYVYLDERDNKYVILDGQQRVISLFLYFNNLKTIKTLDGKKVLIDFFEILKEKDTNNKLLIEIIKAEKRNLFRETKHIINNGDTDIDITYKNLGDAKRIWGSRYIDVVFLDVKSKTKESVYSNIFNLLNSGGTLLKPQEIRNGVYKSNFYDMLHELNNKNVIWRKLYGAKHVNSRDVELLLRFLALEYFTIISEESSIIFKSGEDRKKSVYKGSVHSLLDEFSQKAIDFSKAEIENYRNNLNSFLEKFDDNILDEDVLLGGSKRKNKQINHLLMEALYVAYIKSGKNRDKFSKKMLEDITEKTLYRDASKNSTSNKANIQDRLTAAFEELRYGTN
ncbi:MAG: DUF262 domain-containing protein [Anaeromicrobium sp.]|jgi:hypothetical protein|uniref:DUF262 domain-containing protein n=1 Tax=Anaeromicrobium sp. TaxID=1929132 RepID=UPI0025FA16C4|nr:DUF262 domain-containing protein [Anaeromicrobium sp.]MCT4594622.1 DUF262 domain-containing protein [Anaeromicrobium sp.]